MAYPHIPAKAVIQKRRVIVASKSAYIQTNEKISCYDLSYTVKGVTGKSIPPSVMVYRISKSPVQEKKENQPSAPETLLSHIAPLHVHIQILWCRRRAPLDQTIPVLMPVIPTSKTINGALSPSSKEHSFIVELAIPIRCLPTFIDPVNEIFLTARCVHIFCPTDCRCSSE